MVDFDGKLLKVKFDGPSTPLEITTGNEVQPIKMVAGRPTRIPVTDSIRLRSIGIGVASTLDGVFVRPDGVTKRAIRIKALSGQTKELIEVQDDNDVSIFRVTATGGLNIKQGVTFLASGAQHSISASQGADETAADNIAILGAAGGPSVGVAAGGAGSSVLFTAGGGGAGTATFSSGKGGDIELTPGVPGANNGGGSGAYGIVRVKLGTSTSSTYFLVEDASATPLFAALGNGVINVRQNIGFVATGSSHNISAATPAAETAADAIHVVGATGGASAGGGAGGAGSPILVVAGNGGAGDATNASGGGGTVTLAAGVPGADGGGGLGTAGSVLFQTNATNRLEIDKDGAWLIGGSAGTAGQVPQSNGSGSAVAWASPATIPKWDVTTVITGTTHSAAVGELVQTDPSTNAITVTLPAISASNKGKVIHVKIVTGTAGQSPTNNVTVGTTGGDTIDGQSTFTISANRDDYAFVSDGTSEWLVI